jgi:hypothetical protein
MHDKGLKRKYPENETRKSGKGSKEYEYKKRGRRNVDRNKESMALFSFRVY